MFKIYNSFINQEFFSELKPATLMKLYEFTEKEKEIFLNELKKTKNQKKIDKTQGSPSKKQLTIDNKEIVKPQNFF